MVTLEDVAAKAGVSRSTASRVINGSKSVSPAAISAVERVIEQLEYVPNRVAQSLASRRAKAVALVVPEDTTRFFGDPFFASVVSGIDEYLRTTDIVLNLLIVSNHDDQKTASYLTAGNADGALVLSHHAQDSFIEVIEQKIPVVYGGRPIGAGEEAYFVDVDNLLGAKTAVEYLLEQGCQRVASITGPLDMRSGEDRLGGYRQAVEAAGGIPLFTEGDFTRLGGVNAMQQLLEMEQPFDGLFVASDLMARGALEVLADNGLRVPDDILLVGFDDSPVALWNKPELTTIKQPSKLQGKMMAKLLLDRLNGEDGNVPSHQIILETELIKRDSA